MKSTTRFSVMLFGLGLAILPAAVISRAQDITAPQNEYSHVRIVRLSFVEGTVTMQRPDLQDWAVAPANTPIQEGFKLSTAEQSFAEVEFENTSTARLGQLSLLNFDQLVMTPNGGKVNRLTLEDGYATFNVQPEGVETFQVKAQDATITLAAGATTRFRVDIDGGAVRVEVFKGAVDVSTPYGQQTLTKDMVADVRPGTEQAFNTSHGITKDAWDQWVEERDNHESVVRNSPTPNAYGAGNNSSYYGWNDLSNYGNWNYFPGYGYGWGPNAGYGWSPYSVGRWCWYPTFGYTWISYEPWGWLPFHYGGWLLQPGFGWTWFPGSFGSWSPGNVNWSQGSGWVGWTPGPPRGRGNTGPCVQGQNCGRIIVRPEVVREGRSVSPANILKVNVAEGKPVARPDILPSRGAMLPGALSTQAAAYAGKGSLGRSQQANGDAQGPSGSNKVVIGGTAGVRSSGPRPVNTVGDVQRTTAGEPGVIFDPESRRYVNSNAKPGTANVQPGPAARGSEADDHAASPFSNRTTGVPVQGVSPSRVDTSAPTREAPSNTRIAPGPVNRPSHSEAPVIHNSPAPTSSSRIWGGSRSSSSDGASSRSNGGGRSSGGTSGWSGSSSGGSHSSGGSSSTGGGGGASRGGGSHSSGGSSSGGGSHSSGGSSHK